jgi:hypothetical protein
VLPEPADRAAEWNAAADHIQAMPGYPWLLRPEAAVEELRRAAADTPDQLADTLPAWLAQRFDPRGPDWNALTDDDRAYWEHQARAVRRAVERGGFKPAGGGAHTCRNCTGIDPDTCLMNPDRPKPPPMDPVHILGIGADAAPAVGGAQQADRIVAYRHPATGALFCVRCAPRNPGDIWAPVTAEELKDGGTCVGCGADVLIEQQPKEAGA